MQLTFLGATDTVTGSRFLLEHAQQRILVDCGLFQGPRPIRERNWQPFPVEPHSIDAVLLTHAHIDHSGYLPALVKQGFKGPVYCTPGTHELCRILLPDSGRLQEEEAIFRNRHGATRYHPARPIFNEEHAYQALESFIPVDYNKAFNPVTNLTASFSRVGHILGASYIRVTDSSCSILFSGDIGRLSDPVMKPPAKLQPADYMVMESTYGDRLHPDNDVGRELEAYVRMTVERQGVVIIPAFAVGRAQLILYLLAEAMEADRLEPIPIYLDSPMAINATELLRQFPAEHSLDLEAFSLLSERVSYTRSVRESKAIHKAPSPKIIISASGMATGGRILHHLRHYLPDERNLVLIVGYQAANTRGAGLARGDASVRIFSEDIPVRAQVATLEGLSAHADQHEMGSWLQTMTTTPTKLFLVHGEPDTRIRFRSYLEQLLGWEIELPQLNDSYQLS